jgi:hypothetical protein
MTPLTLTEKEMAEQLRVHPDTLCRRRVKNPKSVPPWFKDAGGDIRYITAEITNWMMEQRKQTLRTR